MATVNLTSQDLIFRLKGNYAESPTVQRVGKANPHAPTLRIATGKKGKPGNYGVGFDRPTTYKTIENPFYQGPRKLEQQQTESDTEEQEELPGLDPEKLDISSLTIPTTQPSQPGRSLQEMVTEMRSKQQQEAAMRMPTIKRSRSQAQRTGLSMKGATGYFGRKGQRISSINM